MGVIVSGTGYVTTRTHCRVDGTPLSDVFDLGRVVSAQFSPPGTPPAYACNLTLAVGGDAQLVQLRDEIDRERLFRHYWYRSRINEKMVAHLRDLADEAARRVSLGPDDVAVDIGANDGTTCANLAEYGCEIVAFEPSDLAERIVLSRGHVVNDFFSADACVFAQGAKLVLSIAMFYDLPDPVVFARDVASILADDGLWVSEQHYLRDMVATNGFDAIVSEHLEYYDLRSFEFIVRAAGLKVLDVERNDMNGGSFRAYVGKSGSESPRVSRMRDEERAPVDFEAFSRRVAANREMTLSMLSNLKRAGKTVAGLGASTKVNTMLQAYGIGPDLLPWIVDRDPRKRGLVMVGPGIPIVGEADAAAMRPDVYFVGPYHFGRQLLLREADFVRSGGQLLIPCPTPHLLP